MNRHERKHTIAPITDEVIWISCDCMYSLAWMAVDMARVKRKKVMPTRRSQQEGTGTVEHLWRRLL